MAARPSTPPSLTPALGWLARRLQAVFSPSLGAQARSRRLGAGPLGESDRDLVARIEWIIRLRWLVTLAVPIIIFLLVKQQILQETDDNASLTGRLAPNLVLAAINFLLNILYSVALRRGWRLRLVAQAQILLDTVIFTIVLYTTGGVASPFTFVYFNPILTACLLLSFEAGLFIAGAASVLYTGMIFLQSWDLIPTRAVYLPLADLAADNASYAVLMAAVWFYAFFLVAILSGLLANVVKKKEADLSLRVGELSLLFDVANLVNRAASLDLLLKEIMREMVLRMDFDRALLYLVTPDRRFLKLKMLARHPRLSRLPPENYAVKMALSKEAGLTARAAVERKLYNITNPQDHPLINKELAVKIGLNPFAVAPMLVRNKVVGVIGADHKYRGGAISDAKAKSLMIFASQAGMTIENARLMGRRHLEAR